MSFCSPEGEEALRPPWSDLRNAGKISRLGEYPRSRWEFSQKGKERTTRGNQSFQKLIRFLYFQVAYILFVIHRDEYRLTRGQQTWPLSKSGASYKIIQKVLGVLHHLLTMRPADILWPFLITVSQPENLFFPGVIFS